MSVGRIHTPQLTPSDKAALLYAQARAELSSRLWDAALGEDAGGLDRDRPRVRGGDVGFDALVALLTHPSAEAHAPLAHTPTHGHAPVGPRAEDDGTGQQPDDQQDDEDAARSPAGGLGANGGYAGALDSAAARTGIPAPALAAIVHAEAAKGPDGRWLAYSRNPRSSAAGLGQFLSGTWINEAERSGTFLHDLARTRGWIDERGHIALQSRASLLALRYDGDTAIQAIADYARNNLNRLRAAGVATGTSVAGIAQSAYVTHHLGVGDAIRFLGAGLDPARARTLLTAQIGSGAAQERIAEAGDATRAHREWLMGFVTRNVRPERFAARNMAGGTQG